MTEPHPQRCETCKHLKRNPSYWSLICQYHDFDVITKQQDDHIRKYGCASHSSTPAPAAMISGRSLSNEKEYVIRESQLKQIQDMIFHEDEEKFLKLSWKILSNPAISSDCPYHNELSCMMTPEGHDAAIAKAEREWVLDLMGDYLATHLYTARGISVVDATKMATYVGSLRGGEQR